MKLTFNDSVFESVDDEDEDEEAEEAESGDAQNCAFFTLEILVNTSDGLTFPMIVTFFVCMSMLNDDTPTKNQQNVIFFFTIISLKCTTQKSSVEDYKIF